MVEATSMFQNLLKIGMLVWGKADSETSPKRSLRRKLFKACCMNWGKLIQLMHTTMVPVQLNTLKIQAGVQVSRLEELKRHLQLWKRYGRLYLYDLWRRWRLAFLPIRFGGLGLYWAKVVSLYEFVASRAQSWVLQDHVLRDTGICGMDDDYVSALACLRYTIPSFDFSGSTNKDTAPSKAQQTLANVLSCEIVKDIEVHFDMTMRQKVVFECLRPPHAQNFLLAIPIYELGQHMSPVKYRTILKYRLMIPLFPVDVICPVYRKTYLDSFGKHAVHRKELPGFKYRHDRVRDVLFDIWKHACVDLVEVFPLVGLSSRGFTVGQIALKAASCKVTKHEKACIENQYMFILFAFDTFGFLAPEAMELLKKVQHVMHNNAMTLRSTYVVLKRISFAIQKVLAVQLVARLLSIIV
ncbi:hypothetical protein Tco_1327307 [Tanacetum coccineum]